MEETLENEIKTFASTGVSVDLCQEGYTLNPKFPLCLRRPFSPGWSNTEDICLVSSQPSWAKYLLVISRQQRSMLYRDYAGGFSLLSGLGC